VVPMRMMRAVVVRAPGDHATVEEVTVDDPGPGEVLVRIAASGICGSDLHVLHGRTNAGVHPVVLGHEGAGTVEVVGDGVTSVAVGDAVIASMGASCGPCCAATPGGRGGWPG
jgi:Zn-dependent alcohol dehydrogenase